MLPDDFPVIRDNDEVEDLLRRSRAAPPAGLRQRVLAAAQHESPTRFRAWRMVAGVAAAALLWLHLSWSAAMNMRWECEPPTVAAVDAAAEQVRELAPDLPWSEARRLAFLIEASQSPHDRAFAVDGSRHR